MTGQSWTMFQWRHWQPARQPGRKGRWSQWRSCTEEEFRRTDNDTCTQKRMLTCTPHAGPMGGWLSMSSTEEPRDDLVRKVASAMMASPRERSCTADPVGYIRDAVRLYLAAARAPR